MWEVDVETDSAVSSCHARNQGIWLEKQSPGSVYIKTVTWCFLAWKPTNMAASSGSERRSAGYRHAWRWRWNRLGRQQLQLRITRVILLEKRSPGSVNIKNGDTIPGIPQGWVKSRLRYSQNTRVRLATYSQEPRWLWTQRCCFRLLGLILLGFLVWWLAFSTRIKAIVLARILTKLLLQVAILGL